MRMKLQMEKHLTFFLDLVNNVTKIKSRSAIKASGKKEEIMSIPTLTHSNVLNEQEKELIKKQWSLPTSPCDSNALLRFF